MNKVKEFTDDYMTKFYNVREDNKETLGTINDIIGALGGLNASMDIANEKAQTLKTDTVDAISKAMTDISEALTGAANAASAAGAAAGDQEPEKYL